MKRVALGVAVLALAVLGLMTVSATAEEEAAETQMFTDQKCNMCHGVSTVGIEAKTKSEKMKGPDLVNLAGEWDGEKMIAYMTEEVEKDGKKHKQFKGTDEELQALVDWLLEQKAEG